MWLRCTHRSGLAEFPLLWLSPLCSRVCSQCTAFLSGFSSSISFAVLYHCVDFCPVIANLCLLTQFYAAFLSRLQSCPAAYALTTVTIVVKGKGKSWPSVCLFLESLISLIMVWPPRLAARTKASSRPAVFNADVLLFPLLLPLFLLFKYANEEIFTENFSIMGGILGFVSSVDASNQVTVRSFLYIILCKSELIQVVVIWIRYTCDEHKTEGKSRSLRLISLCVVLLRLWHVQNYLYVSTWNFFVNSQPRPIQDFKQGVDDVQQQPGCVGHFVSSRNQVTFLIMLKNYYRNLQAIYVVSSFHLAKIDSFIYFL